MRRAGTIGKKESELTRNAGGGEGELAGESRGGLGQTSLGTPPEENLDPTLVPRIPDFLFFFKRGHGSQDSGVWLSVCMYVLTYVCIYIHGTS
jgi:hypothetical protein